MFATLSSRLKDVTGRLRGRGRLTEKNIRGAVRDVRRALLEADVALPVVKSLVERVRERALGMEVARSTRPGDAFVKVLQAELVTVLGNASVPLELGRQPPVVMMLVGLQGVGKTTTAAKLGLRLSDGKKRSVAMTSLDVRRPAAMEQLAQLARDADIEYLASSAGDDPVELATAALQQARVTQYDVLIVDTAGRARVDQALMTELSAVSDALGPTECLLAVDAMAGQEALASASAFRDAVELTGVILTKADGDARGGAVLSVAQELALPIKLIGTGEKLDAIDEFHPDRMASRILGMGDVATLTEQVVRHGDVAEAERVAKKIRKGKGFDLQDMRNQLAQMMDMGGLGQLLEHLPLPGNMSAGDVASRVDEGALKRQVAIIDSMTVAERRRPRILDASRKRRVAAGSGCGVQDVNRLLKQFTQMQKIMKRAGRGGGLPGLGNMMGR